MSETYHRIANSMSGVLLCSIAFTLWQLLKMSLEATYLAQTKLPDGLCKYESCLGRRM